METVKYGMDSVSSVYGINKQEVNEKVVASLEGLDRGGGKELAKNSADNLVSNIDKVEVLSDNDKRTRIPEGEIGRKIFSAMERMVQLAGDEAKLVILTNFNLQEYCNASKNELSLIERDVEKLENEISETEVTKPEKDDFLLMAEVDFKKKETEMRAEHQNRVEASLRNDKKGKRSTSTGKLKVEDSVSGDMEEAADTSRLEVENLVTTQRETIELYYKEKYLEELALYQNYVKNAKVLERKKKQLKSDQEKKLILNIHMQGILSAIGRILTKIKNAVQTSSRIKGILEGIIKIEQTGERIHNSFETNNISGIYQALYDNYGKANFVTFTNDFLSTMSIAIDQLAAKNDPMKAVQKVELMFATWEVMSYWGYMSKDIFWTGILLNSFPKGAEIREKLIFETNKFIRQKEVNERDVNDSDMPVYDHLRDYIKTIQDSQELHGQRTGVKEYNNDGKQTASTQQRNGGYNFNARGKHESNLESAAVAEDEQQRTTQFTGEVDRALGVMSYSNEGKRRPYTATKKHCTECSQAKHNAGAKTSHAPMCYLGQCHRCNNFGHQQKDCKQNPTSFQQAVHEGGAGHSESLEKKSN